MRAETHHQQQQLFHAHHIIYKPRPWTRNSRDAYVEVKPKLKESSFDFSPSFRKPTYSPKLASVVAGMSVNSLQNHQFQIYQHHATLFLILNAAAEHLLPVQVLLQRRIAGVWRIWIHHHLPNIPTVRSKREDAECRKEKALTRV